MDVEHIYWPTAKKGGDYQFFWMLYLFVCHLIMKVKRFGSYAVRSKRHLAVCKLIRIFLFKNRILKWRFYWHQVGVWWWNPKVFEGNPQTYILTCFDFRVWFYTIISTNFYALVYSYFQYNGSFEFSFPFV